MLTGLPNRAGFRERLRERLERADAGTKLAVVALDLDRFKVLNESLGHDVADEVLVQLADRIRRQLRADDLLGRVGSDEFGLAFEIDGPDTAVTVVNKILGSVGLPLQVADQELVLGASIGIALYPADDSGLDGLIRHAETALNQAKSAGGGRHHFWQTHMSVAVRRRLDMETDLRKALERSELMLFYQPQMNLGSGMVTGVEALIRWQHPQRGLVSPADFIPLAEDTGLIGPIGEWVLREACRQNRLWQQHGLPPLRMAVNVSGHQLAAPEFVDTVARALEETDHAPQRLELEITETTLMRDLDASAKVLSRLRSPGAPVDRRFRHRLFVTGLPETPARADGQDRPLIRRRVAGEHPRRRHHQRHHRHGSQPGPGDRRRRRRDGRPAALPARTRLRRDPGLPAARPDHARQHRNLAEEQSAPERRRARYRERTARSPLIAAPAPADQHPLNRRPRTPATGRRPAATG